MTNYLPPNQLEDGRELIAIKVMPPKSTLHILGCSQDGTRLVIKHDSKVVRFKSERAWYPFQGRISWQNGDFDDYANATLKAKPTVGVSNPGSGNFAKYEIFPGGHMFIPGGDAWDVDLSTATPVPNVSKTGMFDYDETAKTLVLNAGAGSYDVFDFEIDLHKFVQKIPGLASSNMVFDIPDMINAKLFSQWELEFELVTSKTSLIQAALILTVAIED